MRSFRVNTGLERLEPIVSARAATVAPGRQLLAPRVARTGSGRRREPIVSNPADARCSFPHTHPGAPCRRLRDRSAETGSCVRISQD
jgi:hypothetical protein